MSLQLVSLERHSLTAQENLLEVFINQARYYSDCCIGETQLVNCLPLKIPPENNIALITRTPNSVISIWPNS